MNFHKGHGRLVCHTCCAERVPPKECPSCTAPSLRYLGTGSERVEDVTDDIQFIVSEVQTGLQPGPHGG